jgi:hypothetical protein
MASAPAEPQVKMRLGMPPGRFFMLKQALVAAAILALTGAAQAATKPCSELEAEIAAKLDAKGVKGYEITVVAADKLAPQATVVGSCEGGSKKLTLVRK